MSQANVALIEGMYAAIARGDIGAFTGAMAPDIVWNEAEGFPYADNNPYRGPAAVMGGVFARLAAEWDGFAATPAEFVDGGDVVIAFGRYTGTCKATGKALDVPFAHVWGVASGKAARFQQYTDTLATAVAMGR